MVEIEVSEGSDNQVYPFVIKQRSQTTAEDLTNYTTAVMTLLSKDLKTNHGDITLAFGTKTAGEINYTTDTADPYPSIPARKKVIDLLGKIKITGSGLKEVTEEINIKYRKDYSTIT